MFSLSKESKFSKTLIFVVLAAFLFLCIFASIYYNDSLLLGSLEKFDNDDVKYLRSAKTLLETGQLTYNYPDQPTVFIMPGIVFLITPFVAIFGMEGAIIPIRIFFAVLQTFNIFMTFLIARKLFNSKVAIISIILSLFYLPNVYVTTVILTETPAYTCILLMIYMIMYGTEKSQKRYFVLGGIAWGIAVLFRPTMLAFPLVVFFYWLMKKVKFLDMVKFGLCALVPLVILMSPWVIRNYMTFGKFIPLTISSGNPKVLGTIIDYSPEETERMYSVIERDDLVYERNEIVEDTNNSIIADRIIEYNMKTRPLEYIKWNTIGKTYKNFSHPFMWKPIYMDSYEPINYYHIGLLKLFVFGFIVMMLLRKAKSNIIFLFLIVAFFNCVHLPYYCFARYVYPAMAMVIMIDSYIIYSVFSKIFKRKDKSIQFVELNKDAVNLKKIIIVPAYNEEEAILDTVNKIKKYMDFDYIVINDGSLDNTEKILGENGINHITLIKNLGIGGAMQSGYKYAMEHGYDIAVQIDADGQHNPEYLEKMVEVLKETNSDMVIGSRYIEKEGFQSTASRRFGKNILTFIIKTLTKTTITDPTSGFRVCSKNAILMFANGYPVDYPEPETVVQLLAKGRTVAEVPVKMNDREGGTSSITPVKSLYYMIKVSISMVFSYINNRKRNADNEC